MVNFALLAWTYLGVQHFTGHNCIAIASVCGLLYLGNVIKQCTKFI